VRFRARRFTKYGRRQDDWHPSTVDGRCTTKLPVSSKAFLLEALLDLGQRVWNTFRQMLGMTHSVTVILLWSHRTVCRVHVSRRLHGSAGVVAEPTRAQYWEVVTYLSLSSFSLVSFPLLSSFIWRKNTFIMYALAVLSLVVVVRLVAIQFHQLCGGAVALLPVACDLLELLVSVWS
jgi:hypothetical protein